MSSGINCLLGCGADSRRLAPVGVGSKYLQCQGCGLAFVHCQPDASVLERQYLDDISSTVNYYQATAPVDMVTFSKRLRLLAELQPQRGRLLDVGCNVGTLMRVAREMGWEVEGLEPNSRAVDLARQQGLSVHEGFFTGGFVRRLRKGYQTVVMNDVIEHLVNPLEALRLARELLEPGGLLLVSTPNLQNFWCRKLQLKPREHLFLFNSHNLRLVLEREAYEVSHLGKTSRRRALDQLIHSTTDLGWGFQTLIGGLCWLRLDGGFAWMIDCLFRDELLIIARRTGGIFS